LTEPFQCHTWLRMGLLVIGGAGSPSWGWAGWGLTLTQPLKTQALKSMILYHNELWKKLYVTYLKWNAQNSSLPTWCLQLNSQNPGPGLNTKDVVLSIQCKPKQVYHMTPYPHTWPWPLKIKSVHLFFLGDGCQMTLGDISSAELKALSWAKNEIYCVLNLSEQIIKAPVPKNYTKFN